MDINKIIDRIDNRVNKNTYDINNIKNNRIQNNSINNGIVGIYDISNAELRNGMISKNVRASTTNAKKYLTNLENNTLLGPSINGNSLYFYWKDINGNIRSLRLDGRYNGHYEQLD